MTDSGRRRLKRFAISTALAIAATIIAGYLIGPVAALVAGVVGFLGTAIAADDELGTCLPFAVFFLIGVMLLLMVFVGTILINS